MQPKPQKVFILIFAFSMTLLLLYGYTLNQRREASVVRQAYFTKNLNGYPDSEKAPNGKTKVIRFSGTQFERLQEFCTWTQPFHCSMLKTPAGKIPIFHHDPAIDPLMGAQLAKNGQRDVKEIAIVMRELEKHPDAMFLDLGANVGIYTLTIAKTLKRKIIAVEPVIQNAAKLCKSIQENGFAENVTLVFNPLSDQHMFVDMMKPPKHLSGSKVIPANGISKQDDENPTCPKDQPYTTVCLDDLLPFMTSKTAIIKIDVESFEYNAIKGGQRFLDEINVPFIFMEWEHVKKKADSHKFVELMKKRSFLSYSKDGNVLPYEDYKTWPFDIVWRKKYE